MYRGTNKIVLNQATLLEAVNMWLKNQHINGRAPTASTIEERIESSCRVFHVTLTSADKKEFSGV